MASTDSKISTDVDFKTFVHGASSANAQQVLDFIREKELKRDQIISITMHETKISVGQNAQTIFYRLKSLKADSTPFDELSFVQFTKTKSWEQQLLEADKFAGQNCNILALTNSAKNVMDLKNSIMWYSNESGGPYTFTTLRETDGDWDRLIREAHSFLNKYIAPHQLISVSFFEAQHPNVSNDRAVYAKIVHTAGDSPVELRSVAKDLPPQLYQRQVFKGVEEIGKYYDQAKTHINAKGGEEGHLVASANVTSETSERGGEFIVVVLSWQQVISEKLVDSLRPAGCCTIF